MPVDNRAERAERAARTRRWLRRRVWLVVAVIGVLLLATIGIAAARGSGTGSYRTAAAQRGAVQATIESAGTIQPINRAELSFPIAGQVSAVPVAVGQQVAVGQPLAQLDTTSLDAQVANARSQLASAQARLAADLQGQTAAGPVSMGGPSVADDVVVPAAFAAPVAGPAADPAAGGSTASPGAQVSALQAKLLADQHQADVALAAANRELAAATAACAGVPATQRVGPGASVPPAPSSEAPAPSSEAPAPSSSGAAPAPGGPSNPPPAAPLGPQPQPVPAQPDPTVCLRALQVALAGQTEVSRLQQAVAADAVALDAAVAALLGSAGTPPPAQGGGGQPPAPQPPGQQPPAGVPGGAQPGALAGSGGGAGSGAGGAAPGGRAPASSAQLAADQAAVDSAEAALTSANQNLAQAQLVSPIAGVVGAVRITAGQQVGPGPAEPQIVVVGEGGHQVITSVGETSVGSVRAGDPATVIPDGADNPVSGTVVSVGLLPTADSTAGSVSYPVTIGLAGADRPLFAGQGAAVTTTLAHVDNVVSVPSSAVHATGGVYTVAVLRDGRPVRVPVTVGAIGSERTEITAGIAEGDEIVLADLSQPLPANGTGGLGGIRGGG